MSIPGSGNVAKALLNLKRQVRECRKRVDLKAGRLLTNGKYSRAEDLIEQAKSIDAFRRDVDKLQTQWRELRVTPGKKISAERTALWEYYQSILQALVELGGAARIGELEPAVGSLIKSRLLQGVLEPMSRGQQRWQKMIRRARNHMVQEGFLDANTGQNWKITAEGRRAAEARDRRGPSLAETRSIEAGKK